MLVMYLQKGIKMALSPKEIEVLTLIALGYSDKEICFKLKLAYGTVRTYVDRIVLKLKARNRANAIIIYKLIQKDWLEEYVRTTNNNKCELLQYG